MRLFRILLFTFINLILFMMLKVNYEIIYKYYFGDTVYIPVLPPLYIYLPVLFFQILFQILLFYELLFNKFITKKLNWLFFIPILIVLLNLNNSPYDKFKKYPLPNFKIQELMFKIQTELEAYRVKYKYYPKIKDRFFEKIISKIEKNAFITDYTLKTNKLETKIIYNFDVNNPYIKNTLNLKTPSIVINISSDGKHYYITAIVKNGFTEGQDIILNYNGKPFILKDDIFIREKLRNKSTKSEIFNNLKNSIKNDKFY